MKKKMIVIVLAIVCCLMLAFGLSACVGTTPNVPTHMHNYQWVDNGDGTHNGHCSIVGCDKPDVNNEKHVWGADNKCAKCLAVKPEQGGENPPNPSPHSHVWSNDWTNDDTHHWHNCTTSGCAVTDNMLKDGYAEHIPGVAATETTPQLCTVCGYVLDQPLGHTHSTTSVAAKDAKCTVDGNIAYYTCSCGKWFSDKNATIEITDRNSIVIDKLGHTIASHSAKTATCTEVGWNAYDTCSRCDYTTKTEIPALGHSVTVLKEEQVTIQNYEITNDNTYPFTESDGIVTSTNTVDSSTATYTITALRTLTLQIQYKVSSEEKYDYLIIKHNNNEKAKISGASDWTSLDIAVNAGDTVLFIYSKDSSQSKNNDCGYIKLITAAQITETHSAEQSAIVTSDNITAFNSTCTEDLCCMVCNTVLITRLGHNIISHSGQAETCTENGWNPYDTCSRCDYSTYSEIAPAHQYVNYYCARCEEHDPMYVFSKGLNYEAILENNNIVAYKVTNIGSFTGLELIIPEYYMGKPVTRIGWSAFNGCSRLTSLTIPNNVTYIDGSAFSECSSLTSIEIPDGVTSISERTFSGCSKLISIIIPNSVTSIGDNVFSGCTALTSLSIPNSVVTIGKCIFSSCSKLNNVYYDGDVASWCEITFRDYLKDSYSRYFNLYIDNQLVINLVIPNTVSEIKKFVFGGCNKITSVEIPSSVKNIAQNAFFYCDNLTNIYYTGSIATWCEIDGLDGIMLSPRTIYIAGKELINELIIPAGTARISGWAFYNCSRLTSVEIPNSVTSIGNHAFYGCNGLTSINIPISVTSIGGSAFSGCNGLTSITIPNSVNSIGGWAFSDCSGVTNVEIQNGVVSIGERVFSGCSGLTSITIPNSITNIENNAFYGCSGLKSIAVDNRNSNYAGQDGILYNKAKTEFIYIPNAIEGSITIPNGITSIVTSAFSGRGSLTNIEIPNSVTKIEDNAFMDCIGLTNIEIPNNVISIGWRAFWGCSGLMSIKIPNSVTSISNSAFYGCSGLKSVEIPDSVTSIGSSVFYGCNNIVTVIMPTIAISTIVDSSKSSLDTVVVNGGNSVPSSAFAGCINLIDVTIGESVTSIGEAAFSGCNKIDRMTLPFVGGSETVDVYGRNILFGYIFGTSNYTGAESTSQMYYRNGVLTTITHYIPTSLKSVEIKRGNISYRAFDNCKYLTNITLGNSVTSIGASAFSGCSGLKNVTIGCNVTSIGDNAFSSQVITAATLPTIAISAILNTSKDKLETVVINGGDTVNAYLFQDCKKLTSVTIGDSVVSIGNYAFSGCTELKNVIVGNSITSIGEDVFKNCNNILYNEDDYGKYLGNSANPYVVMMSVKNKYNSTQFINADTRVLYKAFSGCSSLTSIEIPNSVVSIAQSAFSSCWNLTSIEIPNSVTIIGYMAFYGCSGLTSVTIPNGVTIIENNAFYGCSGLTNIEIPYSITSIGNLAFYNCTKLTRINYIGTQDQWDKIAKGSSWDSNTGNYTLIVSN